MKWSLILAAVSTLALLAGCATQQTDIHNAYAQLKADIHYAYDQLYFCTREVIDRPEFAALAAHTHFGPEVPASELVDERLPTREEARLVVARWDAEAPCRQAFLAAMAGPLVNRPDVAQIGSALYAQAGMNTARFAKGHMTWGQRAEAGQAVDVAWKAQTGAADAALNAQLRAADAEARQEAANRAATAAAIVGATMPRPPQTIYVAPCDVYARIARAC